MSEGFEEVIEDYIGRLKDKYYYTTRDIMDITGISERSLRYRIKELKEYYKNVPSMLKKENRKWLIHYSITDKFLPKYKPRTETPFNMNWKTHLGWTPLESYDVEYHNKIIEELIGLFPNNIFLFTVEKTEKGVNHVHMLTDVEHKEIDKKLRGVLYQYLSPIMVKTDSTPLHSKTKGVRYLHKGKAPYPFLYKPNSRG